jgi:hypothetical protein
MGHELRGCVHVFSDLVHRLNVRAHRRTRNLARRRGAPVRPRLHPALTRAPQAKLGLAAAIGQCPYGGSAPVQYTPALLATIGWGLLDYARQVLGLAPVYVPTAAARGSVGVMTVPGWEAEMFAIADAPGCAI